MKRIKKKYRKKQITINQQEPQEPCGRWCDYYRGRLPYPIECQTNKKFPVSKIYKGDKIIPIYDRSKCITCERYVDFISWKLGKWDRIMDAIDNKEDLRNMPSPIPK